MAKARGGHKGNENAKKWMVEDEFCLHHAFAPLRAKGLSDRKAAQEVARSRKLYSQFPETTGPQHVTDSEQKRAARYLKRLRRLVPRLAKLLMPYMTVEDLERVGSKIDAARRIKNPSKS